jgi:hypothetical protein
VVDVARVRHALLLAERAKESVEQPGRVGVLPSAKHPLEAAEGVDRLAHGADLGDAAEDDHGGAQGDGRRRPGTGSGWSGGAPTHVVESAGPAENVERAERVPVREAEAEAAHDEVEERG